METIKRKFAFWLAKDQADKFDAVFRAAKKRDGRTNYSEVIKELMGFPPDEGVKPVTTEIDRQYLAGLIDSLEGQHFPDAQDLPSFAERPKFKVKR